MGSLPGPEYNVPPHKRTSRRRWLEENREQIRERQRVYREEHREELNAKKKAYYARVRLEGIAAYGGCCSCCGENATEFLTLEHANGREPGDRVTGQKAWSKLKSRGWPEDYTVLCFNCNCARGIYGICPHEAREEVPR